MNWISSVLKILVLGFLIFVPREEDRSRQAFAIVPTAESTNEEPGISLLPALRE